jgi:recombination protein RecA
MAIAPGSHFIPTGSLRLDLALGTGGLPRGRVTEIHGPEGCGKTTLCHHLIAEAQKLGGECAFIDVEGALDPGYARRCGVCTERLYVSQPDCAEQALEITETLTRSGSLALIVVDSIRALVSKYELDIPLGESWRDQSNEMLSKMLHRLRQTIHRNDLTLIFTNQLHSRRGPIYHKLASNPARLALKLHSAVSLSLQTQHWIYAGSEVVGQRIRVTVSKNRYAPYQHSAELDIMYSAGIVTTGELFDLGVQCGAIQRQGGQYRFRNVPLGASQEAVTKRLQNDAHLRTAIGNVIRQRLLPARTFSKEPGRAW